MSQAVAFEDFFQKSRAEVPKPKNLPRGHYTLVLRGVFKRPPKEEGKSGQLSFSYEAVTPQDDVDPSEMEAFQSEGRSIKDNKPKADFWLGNWNNVQAVWNHLAVHGVNVDDFADLDTALKAAVNKRVVAYVQPDTYIHPVKGPQFNDLASGFKAFE